MERTDFIAKPGEKEITITRTFDAPREVVFKAYTNPKLVPQWWGPRIFKTIVKEMEVVPGGKWRFIHTDKDGKEFAFNGFYSEVIPPKSLVYTFEYEGMPGHIMTEAIKFEEENGKTKATTTDKFESVQERDGMLNSGMEWGARESMDRFAELLAKNKNG